MRIYLELCGFKLWYRVEAGLGPGVEADGARQVGGEGGGGRVKAGGGRHPPAGGRVGVGVRRRVRRRDGAQGGGGEHGRVRH
jgi:hypothetical protein